LREFAARVRYRVVGSPFELSFLHWQHARRLWPAEYRERMRLRPPAVLKVSLANAYPRCYATRRIGTNGFISDRLLRAARRMRSPPDFSICSKFAAARSRFAAIPAFPAACIPK
jgi:hypothetical protein